MTTSQVDRYVVIGNPVAHSKSPLIHRLFAQAAGQLMSYETLLVEPGQFAAALAAFKNGGGKGANVTVPFKEDAWRTVDQLSDRAKVARAVNTIAFGDDGVSLGDNTDGIGLTRDLLYNHNIALGGRRILIVGAGGAVRGILQPLLDTQPARVAVVNRTARRAIELADYFRNTGYPLWGGGFDELEKVPFDVIINGTAASLHGELPPLDAACLAPGTVCYDMMYGKADTPFMSWAKKGGASRVVDGLGMLVEQAAEAFFIWRGVRPATAEVINAVRESLV